MTVITDNLDKAHEIFQSYRNTLEYHLDNVEESFNDAYKDIQNGKSEKSASEWFLELGMMELGTATEIMKELYSKICIPANKLVDEYNRS